MRFLFIFIFFLPFLNTQAQDFTRTIDSLGFHLYSIDDKQGKIDYLVSKNRGENIAKPTIIFLQGSLPKPLIINTPQGTAGVFPFNHYLHDKAYRFVIISKPGIPVMPASDQLDERYNYRDEDGNFPAEYIENYSMESLVERANKVIKQVKKASWSNGEIILMGHSEGARVGVKVAAENKHIDRLVYLSANPYGRENGILFTERMKMIQGHMSGTDNQQMINERYERFRQTESRDHISFSENLMDDLISIEKPIFVGYGTRDWGSLACDFIPLEFVKAGKDNLAHHPYIDMEHNFFSVKEDGNVDYNAYHWDEVMKDVIDWINE
jgi:esterase/lipase